MLFFPQKKIELESKENLVFFKKNMKDKTLSQIHIHF